MTDDRTANRFEARDGDTLAVSTVADRDRADRRPRLVAIGATSREVGAQLFPSPRTIEAHLRSIVREPDVTSRRQLRDLQLP